MSEEGKSRSKYDWDDLVKDIALTTPLTLSEALDLTCRGCNARKGARL